MAIKNWTVTAESTDSVFAREIYLLNAKHPNHQHTEKIIPICGGKGTAFRIHEHYEQYRTRQLLARKGGRPPKAAVEFVFTLPKGIRPSKEDWTEILKQLVSNLAKSLSVPSSELISLVRAVVHQQNQSPEVKGTGDHMHVVIGKFTQSGTHLRQLQKKATLLLIKQVYNQAILSVLGLDHTQYQAEKSYQGMAKKKAPTWKVKAKRRHEAMDAKQKALIGHLTRLQNQVEKWVLAYQQNNIKQLNRQDNRLCKTLSELGAISAQCAPEEQQKIKQTLAQLMESIALKRPSSKAAISYQKKFCFKI